MEWCGASLIYVDRWMVALPLITSAVSKDMALLLPISLKSQLTGERTKEAW